MAEKKTRTPKKAAAKTETKAPAVAKPKKEKAQREDRTGWQTFALRMPKSESAALHEAAGSGRASRVMRSLAGAFVTGDRAQFESIVDEARQARR